jgi:hypothetical protein
VFTKIDKMAGRIEKLEQKVARLEQEASLPSIDFLGTSNLPNVDHSGKLMVLEDSLNRTTALVMKVRNRVVRNNSSLHSYFTHLYI